MIGNRLRGTRRPDGITLLEVMVSMLVMTVGVLGLAAIIPLGRLELAEANVQDNAATLGRWAFRDLQVRGYLDPDNWVDPITGLSIIGTLDTEVDPASLVTQPSSRQFVMDGQVMRPPFVPVVIDPLMLSPSNFSTASANEGGLTPAETAHRGICKVFPYSIRIGGGTSGAPEGSPLAPKIPRVTVRTYPSSTAGIGQTNALKYAMRFDVASRFFRSNDDLVFGEPDTLNRRPVQQFAVSANPVTGDQYTFNVVPMDDSGTTAVQRGVNYRKYLGAYSWFVVAEPALAECYAKPTSQQVPSIGGPAASVSSIRQFRFWVVVCHQRDLRPLPDPDQVLPGERGLGERFVWVDFIDRTTARLRVSGITSEGGAQKALDVKTNQWIAVVGRYPEPAITGLTASGGSSGMRYIMEWYRVTGIAERPQHDGDNIWYREVTLAGRDFGGLGFAFEDEDTTFTYNDMDEGDFSVQPLTGWGILVRGVRGVYEKSAHIDKNTLWSMQ